MITKLFAWSSIFFSYKLEKLPSTRDSLYSFVCKRLKWTRSITISNFSSWLVTSVAHYKIYILKVFISSLIIFSESSKDLLISTLIPSKKQNFLMFLFSFFLWSLTHREIGWQRSCFFNFFLKAHTSFARKPRKLGEATRRDLPFRSVLFKTNSNPQSFCLYRHFG